MKHKGREKGILSIEAAVSVTIFMFTMLALFSFLDIFSAKAEMTHVVYEACDSMAFDPYASDVIEDIDDKTGLLGYNTDSNEQIENTTVSRLASEIFNIKPFKERGFADYSKWHEPPDPVPEEAQKDAVSDIFKERVMAYLCGNGTDEAAAKATLKRLHITDVDFHAEIRDGDLYVDAEYVIRPQFNFFGLTNIRSRVQACSKLWTK